ncbi:hypothetical protein BOTBODRAFT_66895 [Botryobasidium botryosum FD-172 SS1]|uniref:FACT complex subunit n=1 Tax=Botryobasidium botryosum (strain FD-172 SS1) TaxID=930990 RepID=A0A067MMM8_BOTB1|nr:hypothetical protein BOTBODRAFT_66895 [Botryobasidium botryosum FD-172 SS1]
MSTPQLNVPQFWSRIQGLISAWSTWLLGYEFPSTIMLFQKEKLYFLCSASKAKILNQLSAESVIPFEVLTTARPKDPPTDAIPRLAAVLANVQRIGTLTKEKHRGRITDEWAKQLETNDNKVDFVDIATAFSSVMAVKDEDELKSIRTASHLSSTLLTHHLAQKLELLLDRQTKISHALLAEQVEARLGDGQKPPDMKVFGKSKHLGDADFGAVETIYTPVIQSRNSAGGYDLKPSAESTEDNVAHQGIILASIGIKYKGYCAQVGRSFLVDPTKEQEQIYQLLLSLQSELLSKLKDGTPARDVYLHALNYVKGKRPELEKNFVKNVGFGMGLEYRDNAYILTAKNTRAVKSDMVFNLSIGFQDLEEKDGKKYALSISDTVKVTHDGAVCLTEGTKTADEVMFFFQDDEPPAAKDQSKKKASPDKAKTKAKAPNAGAELNGKVAGSKVLRAKTRQQFLDPDAALSTAAKIAEHQKELHAQRQEEGIARFAGEGGGELEERGKGWKRFVSYKGEAGLPREVEGLRIFVDRKSQTVILPINGFAVPFHINTLKNVSKSDEGEFTYLRINFQTPGQLAGKKEDTPFEDPDATFIRSVSYRSTDGHRFDAISKQITELKKEVNKREQEKKEMADVIEQDSLVEIKGRRPLRLPEVFVRPALDGKRLPGELEIHQNGLRYQSPLGQKIDLLFTNIKHLFFQPCDHEMLVIVHAHLKSPIMIGKKKAKDVQFYREASDVQFDETGNRKRKYRYGDEDEIELEQNERKRRQALNKEFKHFADKIAEASAGRLELDIPFRELAFEGVPFRTNVKLQPTTECLVHLSDPPFLVITLAEVEIASLERVQFGLRQFDVVFIFNDFSKPPLHINSIPSAQLDNVKEWLDSVEIPLAEGPVNLNWSQIMKTINDNPYEFFKDGGWSFLSGGGDGADASGSDDSDSESEFEADPADLAMSESSTEEDSEFDGDSDASDDSGSEASLGESESSGEDWDELEKKAAQADKKKEEKQGHDSDDSDAKPKKKGGNNSSRSAAKGKSKANGKPPAKGKR